MISRLRRAARCWWVLGLLARGSVALAQAAEPSEVPALGPQVDSSPDSQLAGQGEIPADSASVVAGPTDAEIAQQLAELTGSQQTIDSDGPSLRIYGFADASVSKAFPKRRLGAFPPKGITFAVGNINLYAMADLTRGFSSLLEVRFSYLPNGTFDANLNTTSTVVFDYADWNRANRWGGIVLERVHLDYRVHPLFALRVGQWLTPYGVWNVDHGSPTVIPVNKPYVIGEQLIPTRQSGFQAYGSELFGRVTLAYDITISNGRGDIDQLDLDTNKAAGGHLSLATSELGFLRVGLSGYGGLSTKSGKLAATPGNPPTVDVVSTDQYKELAFGADLLWEWRGLRLQSEALVSQVKYRDPARKLATSFSALSGFIPDRVAWGMYALLAYRLPWLELMPYLSFDYFDRGYARSEILVLGGNTVNVRSITGGLNFRPVPSVVLKGQYSHITFPGADDDSKIPNLTFQFAWAF